jgi:hypothetical protein
VCLCTRRPSLLLYFSLDLATQVHSLSADASEHEPHLSTAQLEAGIKSGIFVSGVLHVSRAKWTLAFVKAGDHTGSKVRAHAFVCVYVCVYVCVCVCACVCVYVNV